jgi:hypothetical protein
MIRSKMVVPIVNYDIPTEPGLYLVIWGGGDGKQVDAVWITGFAKGIDAWVIGSEKVVNLDKAPYNHPLTKFSERIEAE